MLARNLFASGAPLVLGGLLAAERLVVNLSQWLVHQRRILSRLIIQHQCSKSTLGGSTSPNLLSFSPQHRVPPRPHHFSAAFQTPPCGKGGFHQGISLPFLHAGSGANLQIFTYHPIIPVPTRSMAQASSLTFIRLSDVLPSDHSHDPSDDSYASACNLHFWFEGG